MRIANKNGALMDYINDPKARQFDIDWNTLATMRCRGMPRAPLDGIRRSATPLGIGGPQGDQRADAAPGGSAGAQ
jgi:hypothetical protein